MAFSSHVPIYLDPPNLQQHHQQGNGSENPNQQVPISLHDPYHVPGSGTNIRPSSMADRARLAKIHHQEAALKCPRCDSSNTKFCYYNNYSLSQPRYFCKACRRYWTKGGSLRSVPVGGGCRKNKKNKRSSGTSTTSSESPLLKQVGNNSNSKNSAVTVLPSENDQVTGHLPHQTPHLPFMGSLQNLSQFGLGNLGLNFGGIQGDHIGETSRQADLGFQMGTQVTQQHHMQFPFFDPSNGLYPFQSEAIEGSSSIRVSDQLAPVKMENKSRPVQMGGSENNIQYWGAGNNWTNISGLNSSSTNNNHLL